MGGLWRQRRGWTWSSASGCWARHGQIRVGISKNVRLTSGHGCDVMVVMVMVTLAKKHLGAVASLCLVEDSGTGTTEQSGWLFWFLLCRLVYLPVSLSLFILFFSPTADWSTSTAGGQRIFSGPATVHSASPQSPPSPQV